MAYIIDEVLVNNGQFIVAPADGLRSTAIDDNQDKKIKHSAYITGPVHVGDQAAHSSGPTATVMIARDANPLSPQSDKSVLCKGNVMIRGDDGNEHGLDVTGGSSTYPLKVGGNALFDHPNIGDLSSRFNTADGKPVKPFDIEHPTKGKGYRLRHASLEGPESGVYFRGRLKNQNKIKLPNYWKELVHTDSISVQLQPIGAHQNIIIKRWDDEFVYLQGQGAMPINCFFHVYGERKDVNSLMVEYEGNDRYDYPDPNFVENSPVHYEDRNYKDPQDNFPRNTITY